MGSWYKQPMSGTRGVNSSVAEHPASDTPEVFGFLLIRQFSMLAFTSAVEPLRSANRLAGRRLYEWQLLSADGDPVVSSSGIEVVPHASLARIERLRNLIVVAGIDAHAHDDRRVLAKLRCLARRGCRVGALSTGSFLLARAGLLAGHRCTIHWESLSPFREAYPDLEVTGELFEIDRDRFTCSGGTAALDLMLSLIGLSHGRACHPGGRAVHPRAHSRHPRPTAHDTAQPPGRQPPQAAQGGGRDGGHLEDPLSRATLARRAGLSTRQLERLFRKYCR